jgi:tetratricopeptide (TPR) repeat protein
MWWLPYPLTEVVLCPDGITWAGAYGSYLGIYRLEGQIPQYDDEVAGKAYQIVRKLLNMCTDHVEKEPMSHKYDKLLPLKRVNSLGLVAYKLPHIRLGLQKAMNWAECLGECDIAADLQRLTGLLEILFSSELDTGVATEVCSGLENEDRDQIRGAGTYSLEVGNSHTDAVPLSANNMSVVETNGSLSFAVRETGRASERIASLWDELAKLCKSGNNASLKGKPVPLEILTRIGEIASSVGDKESERTASEIANWLKPSFKGTRDVLATLKSRGLVHGKRRLARPSYKATDRIRELELDSGSKAAWKTAWGKEMEQCCEMESTLRRGGSDMQPRLLRVLYRKGELQAELGQPDEARATFQEVVRLSEACDDKSSLLNALIKYSQLKIANQDANPIATQREQRELLDRCAALAEELGEPKTVQMIKYARALVDAVVYEGGDDNATEDYADPFGDG